MKTRCKIKEKVFFTTRNVPLDDKWSSKKRVRGKHC